MPFSVLFLASLTLTYLPLSLSYRDGARSESCYNMLVMHTNFDGDVVSPMECGNACPYELRVVGTVNAESSRLNTLTPMDMDTTYQFGQTYHLQLNSTSTSTFEGFMVEARNSTEDFDTGSTIWGTWVTQMDTYHTVECNRSLTSSEGPFDNAATQNLPDNLMSLDLYWEAPSRPSSSEEYLQLPEQIQFWFVTVQQRLTYFYPVAGPILNRSVIDCGALTNPGNGTVDTPQGTTLDQVATYNCNNRYLLVGNMTRTCQVDEMWSGTAPLCQLMCLNGGTFNTSTEICDCPTGFTGSDCSATAAPTSTPPVTPTQIALNNALKVTLPQYTAENFTEVAQEAMRNTTAAVINRYCAENNEMCRQTVRTRRQVSLIQPSDVIITNIRNNAQGVLEFEMYIQVAGGAQVLAAEVLESAVQSGTNDYMAAGFAAVTFVRVVPATTATTAVTTATTATTAVTTATGLSPGVIAAIAAGSVFGVVLVLILLLLCILFCIHKRWKSYREVQLTYTSVLEKPDNLYVVQNELATVDSPTEDDTQTDGTEKDDMQKDNTQKDEPQKDDTKKDGTQAENDPEDTAL